MIEKIDIGGDTVALVKNEMTLGQSEAFLFLQSTWVETAPDSVHSMRLTLALISIGVDSWEGNCMSEKPWPELATEDDYHSRIKSAKNLTLTQAKKISEAITKRMFLDDEEGKP